MRIVCQRCSAAYAIDDRVVTPRGVRAQCPRCRHLQLVKRDEGAAVPSAPASSGAPPPASGASLRAAPPRPPSPGAIPACTRCGALLAAPYDQALGTCERCRREAAALDDASLHEAALHEAALHEAALQHAALQQAARAAEEAGPPTLPLPRAHAPREVPGGAAAGSVTPLPIAPAVRLGRGGPDVGRLVRLGLVGGLLVGLLAGGAYVAAHPPAFLRAREESPPPPSPLPPALEAAVSRWRASFPGLSGTAGEHLARGQQQLAEGTRASARRAEESFQRALVLEPRSQGALAGYLQAFAQGRGAGADARASGEALALAEVGLKQAGRSPAMRVGASQLLLERAQGGAALERVHTLATEALGAESPQVKAEAHLLLARMMLGASLPVAQEHLAQVEALAPGLGRALPVRARALEAEGHYARAAELLRQRVEQDPEDRDALDALMRLLAEVGDTQAARAAWEPFRGQPDADRALAVLLSRGEGAQPREAVRLLRGLLARREALGAAEVPQLLGRLASAERAAGNPAAARKAAAEALALAPDDPVVHLELLLLALARGDAAEAGRHLPGVSGKLGDGGLEALLEGRVRMAERKPAQALERFLEAARRDPRRVDAQLWAGAAAAAAGRPSEAFQHMLAASDLDPFRTAPPPANPRVLLLPGETLEGADGQLLKVARGTDALPARLYEALVRFHQRDAATADRLLRGVLDSDVNNGKALALRALVAVRRGDRKGAQRLGAQAVRAARQLGLAHAALGEALAAAGDAPGALRAFQEANQLAPANPSYVLRLAALEAQTGARAAAAQRLRKMVARDPADAAAKRALYQLERSGEPTP